MNGDIVDLFWISFSMVGLGLLCGMIIGIKASRHAHRRKALAKASRVVLPPEQHNAELGRFRGVDGLRHPVLVALTEGSHACTDTASAVARIHELRAEVKSLRQALKSRALAQRSSVTCKASTETPADAAWPTCSLATAQARLAWEEGWRSRGEAYKAVLPDSHNDAEVLAESWRYSGASLLARVAEMGQPDGSEHDSDAYEVDPLKLAHHHAEPDSPRRYTIEQVRATVAAALAQRQSSNRQDLVQPSPGASARVAFETLGVLGASARGASAGAIEQSVAAEADLKRA